MGACGLSPHEIGVEVVAGLIAVAGQRERTVDQLSVVVARAVDELDPDHSRDSVPTWLRELPPWARLDAFDRLRKSFDDLLVLEAQGKAVVDGLRSMLNPTVVKPRPMVLTPRQAYDRLSRMADVRGGYLTGLRNAERRVRPRLEIVTASDLRRALRDMTAEEERGRQYRERLGGLLSMADLVAAV